jgi:hypothetical protein
MQWDLAHRPHGVYDFTPVTVEATSSTAAIEQLRQQIPAEDLVLFVRASWQE